MSMRTDLSNIGPSRNERIAPEGGWPVVQCEPEPEMPLGQKMVLLKLRRGEIAAAILEHLREMSAPEPAKSDWSAMIEARYIRRNGPTNRLELMPAGLSKAGAIMRDLAPKYGIHIFTHTGGRGSGRGTRSICSCTKFGAGPFANDRAGESHLRTAEIRHLRDEALEQAR